MRQLGKVLTVSGYRKIVWGLFVGLKSRVFTGGCALLRVFWMVFCGEKRGELMVFCGDLGGCFSGSKNVTF